MATVLLLVSQAPERRLEWVAALTVTMVVCAVVLLMAERLQQVVGERVVSAFERIARLEKVHTLQEGGPDFEPKLAGFKQRIPKPAAKP